MDNPLWFANQTFEVSNLVIGAQRSDVAVLIGISTCRIRGVDDVLGVYEIEVVNGSMDGVTFYAGESFVLKHVTRAPDSYD